MGNLVHNPGVPNGNPGGRLRMLPRLAAGIAIFVGAMVLAGWAGNLPLLKSVLPGAVQMKANTAVGFLLCGFTLLVLSFRFAAPFPLLAQASAYAVAVLGFATFVEYAFDWQLYIDELLFRDNDVAYNVARGRMSPYTAIAFGCAGLGLATMAKSGRWWLKWTSAIVITSIGTVALIGYAWSATELVTDKWLPPVAINTAAVFTVLGLGMLVEIRIRRQATFAMPAAFGRRILAGFAAAVMMLLFVGGLTYQAGADFARSTEDISRLLQVRSLLRLIYSSASDAESMQRNYLITNKDEYRETYVRMTATVQGNIEALRALVAGDADQGRRLDDIERLYRQVTDLLNQGITLNQTRGFAAAKGLVSTGRSIRLMQALFNAVESMVDAEAAQLQKQQAATEHARQRVLVCLLLTLVVTIAIFAFLYGNIRREILARTQAEDEARAGKARTDAIFNTVLDGIITIDESGTVETVNPTAVRLFGYTEGEVVGRNVRMLMPEPHHSQHDGFLRHYLETGEARIIGSVREVAGQRKDGSTFPMELAVSEMPLRTGRRFVGVVRDISQARQLAQEREQAQVQRDRFFTLSIDLLGIADMRGRFLRINPAFTEVLGFAPEEIVSRQFGDFLHPDDLAPASAAMARVRRGERVVEFEARYKCKDGEWKWLSWKVQPFAEEGLLYATGRDVTAHKQSQKEMMLAKEDAEQANRAKSAFLATMSHEIRTPMNGVLGVAEVLAHEKLTEHQADLVATIRDSATSLLGIIDDILDFSKIEAGRLEIEKSPVSLPDLVEGICNSLLPVAARRAVDVALFVSPEVPQRVLSDEVRLRQVLYNLVGNALKFSSGRPDRRGRVSLRVEVARANPLQVTFRVSDNGIGMGPQARANLFTPFTQAQVSTTRRFGGTGLGLAICKRVVTLMNGSIAVESTPDVGSEFTVTLPLETPAAQMTKPDLNLVGLHCILVDHPELDAADLQTYLDHAGATTSVVEDDAAATKCALQNAMQVVMIQYAGRDRRLNDARDAGGHAEGTAANSTLLAWKQGRRVRIGGLEAITLDRDALRRTTFLRTVAVAAGRASPEVVHSEPGEALNGERKQAPTIAEARMKGQLILVAEDDAINQKVILQQLALVGYAAEVANTGVEALRMWREQGHALLLTDLHMPDMDGYELAQAVRREEGGRRRIPIVALTANALRGETNRALAAGMDDYLTKPVQLRILQAALEHWLPAAVAEQAATPVRNESPEAVRADAAVDISVLKGLVGDDPEVVRDFLTQYLASAVKQAHELRIACIADNPAMVGAIAHKLKSSSRSIGALALGDLCSELDASGRAGDRERLALLLPRFEALLAQVEEQVSLYLSKT